MSLVTDYEEFLETLSRSGTSYRWFLTVLVAISTFRSSFDIFLLNLATVPIDFHCSEVKIGNVSVPYSDFKNNFTVRGDVNFSISDYTCTMPVFQRIPNESQVLQLTNLSSTCVLWSFQAQDNPNRYNMLMEYGMVCQNSYLADRIQTILQAGTLACTLFLPIGDIFGRRPILLILYALDFALTLPSIFVTDLTAQMALRFFMGFRVLGTIVSVVIITEFISSSYRSLHANLLWIFWVIGICSSAGIAYFIPNWRVCNAVALGIVTGLYVLAFFYLPESPRWLLTRKKTEKAKVVIKKMARYSNCPGIEETLDYEDNSLVRMSHDEIGIYEYIPRENLCQIVYCASVALLSFINFTVSLIYFAISLQRDFIVTNPYLNFFISGAMELPAYILAWLFSNRIGRRVSIAGCLIISGTGLIISPFLPDSAPMFGIKAVVAIIVKLLVTTAYSIISMFCAEVTPTKVRSISMFFIAVILNSGQFLAPEMSSRLSNLFIHLPLIFYGSFSVVAALAVLILPETKDKAMPTTINDMHSLFDIYSSRKCPLSRNNVDDVHVE